jgi:hypothetical protein
MIDHGKQALDLWPTTAILRQFRALMISNFLEIEKADAKPEICFSSAFFLENWKLSSSKLWIKSHF